MDRATGEATEEKASGGPRYAGGPIGSATFSGTAVGETAPLEASVENLDERLRAGWRRMRRPLWALALACVVAVIGVSWTLSLPIVPSSTLVGEEVVKAEVTKVSTEGGRRTYAVATSMGSVGSAPSAVDLEEGDRVFVFVDRGEITRLEPRAHPALFPASVTLAVVGLGAILALPIKALRYRAARQQAAAGWVVVRLTSHGRGRPKRVLSGRLLANLLTMPFGVRVLAKRTGGRWYSYDHPLSGHIQTTSRRDDARLDRSKAAAVPLGTNTPKVVLPIGSSRFVVT